MLLGGLCVMGGLLGEGLGGECCGNRGRSGWKGL